MGLPDEESVGLDEGENERDTVGLPVGLPDGSSVGTHSTVMTLFIVT